MEGVFDYSVCLSAWRSDTKLFVFSFADFTPIYKYNDWHFEQLIVDSWILMRSYK